MNHSLQDLGNVYPLPITLLMLNNIDFNIQSITFVDMGTIIICKIKKNTVNPSETII
jgi:hypothetical protein